MSIILNRALSTMVPFRYRPMYSVGANEPLVPWHADLENWSSFPSDNATYLFAIAAGLWITSGWAGLLFGAYATFIAASRVFLGIHFPSDVLVGAIIGIATSIVVQRPAVRRIVAGRILALEPRYPPYFYGLLFAALAEVSGGFPITRHIGVAIVHLFVPYGGPKL